MRKVLLFLAICGSSLGEPCWGMDSKDGIGGQYMSVNRRSIDRNVDCVPIENARKRGAVFKLAESLGRVALGTAAIAGTTLVGVGFVSAFRRARAQSGLRSDVDKLKGWKEVKSSDLFSFRLVAYREEKVAPSFDQIVLNKIGYGDVAWLRSLSAQSVNFIFSSYFYGTGIFGLLKTGMLFLAKGYRFGGEQIYKGICGAWNSDNLAKAS